MMFMSMVVHFAEFFMMSLVGIMSYKLYVSYMSWKNACAFSSSSNTAIATEKSISYASDVDDSECLNVTKVTVNLTKTAASQIMSDPLGVVNVKQSQISEAEITLPEQTSATILNDYIGEFFSEPQAVDIDAYRASTNTVESASDRDLNAALPVRLDDNKSDDDYIKVEPLFMVSDSLKEASIVDEVVPTLNEFCDLESDSFITVATINSEIKNSNKIMSDKVVMAMLDEAKLVRFS